MAGETDGEVVVPPTLQALLAARLDQLEPAERSVLERGAVEGEIFHRGAVQALAPEDDPVTPRLAALVRKELIRPDRPQLAGEDGFRFRHLLIRDAAYDGAAEGPARRAPPALRRVAESTGRRRSSSSTRSSATTSSKPPATAPSSGLPTTASLAAAARRRLAAGGAARAQPPRLQRGREPPRARRRVSSLVRDRSRARERPRRRPGLERAGPPTRSRSANALAERARRRTDDRVGELCGRIKAAVLRRMSLEPEGARERWRALVDQALPVFKSAGDDLALYIGVLRAGVVALTFTRRGRPARGVRAGRRARSAGAGRRRAPRVAGGMSRRFEADSRPASCSRGSTRTSRASDGTIGFAHAGLRHWRCSVASTRRARSSPRRAQTSSIAVADSSSRRSIGFDGLLRRAHRR